MHENLLLTFHANDFFSLALGEQVFRAYLISKLKRIATNLK